MFSNRATVDVAIQVLQNVYKPTSLVGDACDRVSAFMEYALPVEATLEAYSTLSQKTQRVRFAPVGSTGQRNTACSLSAGVSNPKVFRGR
jgi:hypothetical protein